MSTTLSAVSVTSSDSNAVDSLLIGSKWSSTSLTYGFPGATASWDGYAPGAPGEGTEPYNGFGLLNADQQAACVAAMGLWQSVCGVSFSVAGGSGDAADIRLALSSAPPTSWAYYPSNAPSGGDVWFGNVATSATWTPGTYSGFTPLHELGHSLGLKHGHEALGGWPAAPADRDSLEFSLMTYRSYIGGTTDYLTVADGSYPETPMMDDIAAVQYLYGANYSFHAGNDTYHFDPGTTKIFETLWDGGGTDTYDASAYRDGVALDLRPGAWSTLGHDQLADLSGDGAHLARGSVANALLYGGDTRSLIENATGGAGADTLTGNQADNMLSGNDGGDRLYGDSGNDTLWGDGGADTLYGGDGTDLLLGGDGVDLEYGGAGADRLRGNNGDDRLYGEAGNDTLYGATGADTLYGGDGDDALFGGEGKDFLFGGAGADRFIFSAAADAGSGTDREVVSDFSHAQGDRLDVSGIDAVAATTTVNDAFTFVGSAAFTGVAGQLRYGGGVVQADVDGDRIADFEIRIVGAPAMVAGDFVL